MPARRWSKPRSKTKQKARADYQRYIKSQAWEDRRNDYFMKYAKQCIICNRTDRIHLHHKTYDRIGAELDIDLVALCDAHHRELHKFHDQRRRVNMRAPLLQSSDIFIAIKMKTRHFGSLGPPDPLV